MVLFLDSHLNVLLASEELLVSFMCIIKKKIRLFLPFSKKLI